MFSALGEEGADDVAGLGVEDEGGFDFLQEEESGVYIGGWVEAVVGDFVFGGFFESGVEEDGDGAEGFGAMGGAEAVGCFFLEHEGHGGWEGSGYYGIEPRGGDGVGEVGDDFERLGFFNRKAGEWVVEGIGIEEVEGVRKAWAKGGV